jgi:hypothetical protein
LSRRGSIGPCPTGDEFAELTKAPPGFTVAPAADRRRVGQRSAKPLRPRFRPGLDATLSRALSLQPHQLGATSTRSRPARVRARPPSSRRRTAAQARLRQRQTLFRKSRSHRKIRQPRARG